MRLHNLRSFAYLITILVHEKMKLVTLLFEVIIQLGKGS